MKLSDVIVRLLWVGTDHPFWYTLPTVLLIEDHKRDPLMKTRGIDFLLRDMYDLREPEGELNNVLHDIVQADPTTWFLHLPLFEEFYAPPD